MQEREFVPSSAASEASSTHSSTSSLYFRRRYDGKKTRREAMEQRFGRNHTPTSRSSPSSTPISKSSPLRHDLPRSSGPTTPRAEDSSGPTTLDRPNANLPEFPDAELLRGETDPHTPPRLAPKVPQRSNHLPVSASGSPVRSVTEKNCQQISTIPSGETAETMGTSITAATSTATTQQPRTPLQYSSNFPDCVDSAGDGPHEATEAARPQHLIGQSETHYYRIVYRGVVALLSEPCTTSQRSGAYVSYGEIVASTFELDVQDRPIGAPSTPRLGSTTDSPFFSPESPPRSVLSQTAASVSSLDTYRTSSTVPSAQPQAQSQQTHLPRSRSPTDLSQSKKAIRVDKVLTGGYAIDAMEGGTDAYDQTPKRANKQNAVPVVGPSPMPMADSRSIPNTALSARLEESSSVGGLDFTSRRSSNYGFLIARRRNVVIAERIDRPPTYETGNFVYKVVSSTPLPILTGPCLDAPKTKAMVLPGTIHEVCLRLSDTISRDNSISFLRLSRRRGWIADRKLSSRSLKQSSVPAMKEVSQEIGVTTGEDCSVSVLSTTASSVATPVSKVRRRHRPPRRKRGSKDSGDPTQLPRHVMGPSSSSLSNSYTRQETPTNFEASLVNASQASDKGVMSPSSNVSMLSDESSLEHATTQTKVSGALTPDRSVARSAASSSVTQPSFFLMRVNAPRGLRILDAPHFQVNNLIHGNHPVQTNSLSPQGPKDLAGQTGNQSIFQTMAGHHTTTLTSKIGNPAIFDSITKARKLPRGSVFEASKRMESSGAFSQGAGLIKLSDNSGWAIVPRQDELDEQYRNYHGALSAVKEGEATRAYEEVGNAIVDERNTSLYLRVLSKAGVTVSLPPPISTVSDDDTSPTSSAAGSSAVSAGGGLSMVSKEESDVASSVGSSFLDAMFRTPKKKELDSQNADHRREFAHQNRNPNPLPVEKTSFSAVIPCGICIEVERCSESKDPADHRIHRQEYARLRGGQGWVPRQLNGKQMLEVVQAPEFRFGSFWFQVQARNGIKVRLGPSRRAPSIKSDEGVYFRFECGEFLRASEIMTVFRGDAPSECFAKLFRNRHVRLHTGHGEVRQLASLTVQAEWVQVFSEDEIFLEECTTDPRIERHRQGWRYNVVLDARVKVRKGPSFAAEGNGVVLLGGESVLINERVTAPDQNIMWLRLKDGQGWVHNCDRDGQTLMIPHSLRHRKKLNGGGRGGSQAEEGEDIAYNQIIARLFHGDLPEDTYKSSKEIRGLPR